MGHWIYSTVKDNNSSATWEPHEQDGGDYVTIKVLQVFPGFAPASTVFVGRA